MKVDKAVCTSNDTLDDLQRAIRYEAVFSTLVEKKILAIKRECIEQDEKKRARREQACFAGRFFRKRRLGSQDQSSAGGIGSTKDTIGNNDAVQTTTETATVDGIGGKTCTVKYTSNGEMDGGDGVATATVIITHNPSDSGTVDETASAPITNVEETNNDDKCQSVSCENVAAQEGNDDSVKQCISGSSTSSVVTQKSLCKSGQQDAKSLTIDKIECAAPTKDSLAVVRHDSPRSIQSKKIVPHVKVVTGSPASTSSRLEVSGMCEDATRRKVSSDTTISFPSSGKQTTFSAPEVLTITAADHERHRLRVLEAKSISAQCSPIFPRHATVDSVSTQVTYRNEIGVGSNNSGGVIAGTRSIAKKLFTRQNTSDDSVNVTFNSIVLNDDGTEIISVADNLKKSSSTGKRGSKKDKTTRDPLGFISNFNQLTAHNNLPVIATQLRAVNTAKLQRYLTTASDGSDCMPQRPKSTDERFHGDGSRDKMAKAITGPQNSDDDETKKNKRKSSELNRLIKRVI